MSPQKSPAPVASPAGAARTGDSLHRTSLVHEKELIESNLNLQARVEVREAQSEGFAATVDTVPTPLVFRMNNLSPHPRQVVNELQVVVVSLGQSDCL